MSIYQEGQFNPPIPFSEHILQDIQEDPNWDPENHMLYNNTRDRRFFFGWQDNYNPRRVRHIDLQGQTKPYTWAHLMEIGENQLPNENPNYFIALDLLLGEQWRLGSDDSTPSHNYSFSTHYPTWYKGYGSGFYGQYESIKEQLINMGAVAIHQEDLPPKINVEATIHAFLKKLKNRDFSPPPFVIDENLLETTMPTINGNSKNALSRFFERFKK